ncbi:MAG: DMT family transporter, partial [Coprococcus sp.]
HHPFRLNQSVIFGGICSASMSITFVCATKMTSAANAIILQFTHPVFLILILWIFYHKRPDKRAILTCIIALIGIVCFFFDKITSGGMLGNLLAIISGLSYAIMFQMKKMKGGDFESSLVISYILAFIIGLPTAMHETIHTPSIWMVIVLLGAVQTGLATICLSRGLDAVSPVTAALTSGIEPILNPVLAAIICGETIGPMSIAGGILVIGSVLAYSLSQIKRPVSAG